MMETSVDVQNSRIYAGRGRPTIEEEGGGYGRGVG